MIVHSEYDTLLFYDFEIGFFLLMPLSLLTQIKEVKKFRSSLKLASMLFAFVYKDDSHEDMEVDEPQTPLHDVEMASRSKRALQQEFDQEPTKRRSALKKKSSTPR